jgi:excisionase family DNA binding protein
MSLSEAGEAFGFSDATLRRLCEKGLLAADRVGRAWRVRRSDMDNYLLARRDVGNPGGALRLAGPATRGRGEAPNPRLRDSYGWRFEALIGGQFACL